MKKIVTATVFALFASVASANDSFEYDFHGMIDFIIEHGPTRNNSPMFAVEVPMPTIDFMTQEGLDMLWPGAFGVYAVYDASSHTVYLHKDIEPNSPEGYSVILHELVHHVQNMNGLTSTKCPSSIEYDAYRIQLEYLRQNINEVDPAFVKTIEMGMPEPRYSGICANDLQS